MMPQAGGDAHLKSSRPGPARSLPWAFPRPRKRTVGVLYPCYNSVRMIYGLDTPRYVHRTLYSLPLWRLDKNSSFYLYTPVILDLFTPLVHTWNALPANKDFIVSFELEMPRYLGAPTARQMNYGMDILSSPRCKAILPMSEFAKDHARRVFTDRGRPELMDKMSVFRGGFRDFMTRADVERLDQQRPSFQQVPFSAVIVGSWLFRKGAQFAIEAFERLRAQGLDVRLTLIGSFELESYPYGEHVPDAAAWEARARRHPWIRFEGPMPNARMLDELRAHDMCIFTSLDESLGWMTVEAGMLGKPVIGTRICAFSELITHGESGWLIDVPVAPDGRWAGIHAVSEEKGALLRATDEAIVAGIETCVRKIFQNPDLLSTWGRRARQRMTQLYGMEAASARLESLYDQAIG